jgi:hypothetical protein
MRNEAEIVEILRELCHGQGQYKQDQLLFKGQKTEPYPLNEWERSAFPSMLAQVEDGRTLSQKQMEAIGSAADRLQLVVRAENLFSKLPPARQQEHLKAARKVLFPWETGKMARPLRPPGKP